MSADQGNWLRGSAPLRFLATASLLVLGLAAKSSGLDAQQCVSEDNHVYLIVTTRSSTIGTQVTSVALSSAGACRISQSGSMGSVVTAYAAGFGPPLDNRVRTDVLSGFATNSLSCSSSFDPSGMGALMLPGPGLRLVSADSTISTEMLHPVASASGGVPAAVDIDTARNIPGPITCGGSTMVFPRGGVGTTLSDPAAGEVEDQSVTLEDTVGSHFGNYPTGNAVPAGVGTQASPDGFLLQGDCTGLGSCQIIVFIGERDATFSTFGVAAAGFSVDGSLIQLVTESAVQGGLWNTATPTAADADTPTPTPTATATPIQAPIEGSSRSLVLSYAKLRVDTASTSGNGLFVLRGIVDDNDTGGDLAPSLLAGSMALSVDAAPGFSAAVVFSGCGTIDAKLHCVSADGSVRATFEPIGPLRYKATMRARRLDASATGRLRATGSVSARLSQTAAVRIDSISTCEPQLRAALVCRQ